MKNLSLRILLVSLALACFAASGAEPASQFKQISKPEPLDDFAWISRKLVKEPAYKSAKIRYTLWALGDGKKSVMTMVWDESGGTGKGYDTYYFDTNFDGDLTAPNKHFEVKGKEFSVNGIKEADGQRTFNFKFVIEGDNFEWQSAFSMSGPQVGYQPGFLPGNLKIQWSNALKDAPVYHFGGPAVLKANGKSPGESMGTWKAGAMAEVGTDVSLVGDAKCQLRFYHSHPPNGEPQIMLRVQDKNGTKIEDIPFTGGCG